MAERPGRWTWQGDRNRLTGSWRRRRTESGWDDTHVEG